METKTSRGVFVVYKKGYHKMHLIGFAYHINYLINVDLF